MLLPVRQVIPADTLQDSCHCDAKICERRRRIVAARSNVSSLPSRRMNRGANCPVKNCAQEIFLLDGLQPFSAAPTIRRLRSLAAQRVLSGE